MDAIQKFVVEQDLVCAVLGNADSGECMLVELRGDGILPDEGQTLHARLKNFVLAGFMGLRGCIADAKCEPVPGAWQIMVAAVPIFQNYLAIKLADPTSTPTRSSDGVDWLRRLHSLRDPRTEN